ncbi:uncharacterized protein G2W53_026702 [Senna tora]|uniref:Uncharacterized protein n=1 Tax=Senna tora TaxID=362788 RepID=A0A834TFK6_9FABA|nr:uncharacterized protein G2W53_026702 [Senna tora]
MKWNPQILHSFATSSSKSYFTNNEKKMVVVVKNKEIYSLGYSKTSDKAMENSLAICERFAVVKQSYVADLHRRFACGGRRWLASSGGRRWLARSGARWLLEFRIGICMMELFRYWVLLVIPDGLIDPF